MKNRVIKLIHYNGSAEAIKNCKVCLEAKKVESRSRSAIREERNY